MIFRKITFCPSIIRGPWSRLVTACAYKDVSGLFTTEVPEELENSTSGGSGAKKETVPVANTEVDDEDELLYGDSAADLFDLAKQEKQTKQSSKSNMSWKR